MIKIGQIGIAHDHAEGKMACVRKYPDIFEIVGVAEENPKNMKDFGNRACYEGVPFMSVEKLLDTPGLDAIMVETEELNLVETAQRCVDKGLHIHVDKPAGDDIAAFERLLKTAKARGLTVQLAYMYRYNPAVQHCLEVVKTGQLGEIYQVDASMNSWYPPEKRLWTNRFPGGNMFFLGCHMVDLVLLTQGVPDRIIALNKSSGIDGISALDHGFAVFEYENGISTVRATLTECIGFNRRQLVVCGDRGVIKINPLEDSNGAPSTQLSISFDRKFRGEYATRQFPEAAGRYDTMVLEFAEIVKGNKANPFTYEYELLMQKAVLAACGLPVEVTSVEL